MVCFTGIVATGKEVWLIWLFILCGERTAYWVGGRFFHLTGDFFAVLDVEIGIPASIISSFEGPWRSFNT